MAGSIASLVGVFDAVVGAFNSGQPADLQTIADYLHDKAAIFTITKHNDSHLKNNVKIEIQNQFAKHAQFTPITEQVSVGESGQAGNISGIAAWQDDDHNIDGQIVYSFNFLWDSNKGWLISTLWGSTDE